MMESKRPKSIVLCFDGTDNEPEDRTNVVRLYDLVAKTNQVGDVQDKKYFAGVGTEILTNISGSLLGVGARARLCEGYDWLAEKYRPGDRVYLFGFSRGAFIARSLVQMIATCGLPAEWGAGKWTSREAFDHYEKLSSDSNPSYPVYRLAYWQRNSLEVPANAIKAPLYKLLEAQEVQQIKIEMAGLWDTVGALGKSFVKDRAVWTGRSGAHNVRLPKALLRGYHAVAIDEHRPMFNVTLWRQFVAEGKQVEDNENFEQRWFCGAHSDVGGGYGDDRLPDISLDWMVDKARAAGLEFSSSVEPQPGAWLAPINDSFRAFAGSVLSAWDKLVPGDQRFYRRIGRLEMPVSTVNGDRGHLQAVRETIDESVMKRFREDPRYRPQNLVSYFQRLGAIPGGAPMVQRTDRIYASQYWNRTGVYLEKGASYCLKVVPGIGEPLRDASHEATSISGEKWSSIAHKTAAAIRGKRRDNENWFALIGTIEQTDAFLIQDGMTYKPTVSGELVCYFNDVQLEAFYSNNSGWRVLEVERYLPSADQPVGVSGIEDDMN